ncbi:Ig-like domain-containing protein [Macrococcus equi]|uniref:Ig-like domain-containing protein n=1 Tax=Macrococcus equi TaxID=3395462 RepID=UPI0039BDACF4
MKKTKKGKLDFIPNTLNKYSIRKFTVGTASILIGSLMFIGSSELANAATGDTVSTQSPTDPNATPTTETPTTEAPTTEAPTTEAPTTEAPVVAPEKAVNLEFNADNTSLTGIAQSGVVVELTLADGTVEKTVADTDGTFTFRSLTVASGEVVKVVTFDGTNRSEAVEVTANTIVATEAPTTEAPTTEAPTTEAPTTEAPTTEAPTTEAITTEAPTTEAATTEAPTTEAPVADAPITAATTAIESAVLTPDTATVDQTTATLNTLATPEEKKAVLTDYLVQNTGVTQDAAVAQLDALNLDYTNLTSDELMAALLQAIATQQDATTVTATPVNVAPSSFANMTSISLDLNAPINTLTAPNGAGDSYLIIDGKNVIESAAFNGTTQHTVNGKVVQQWTGNPLEINNTTVATPLAGVRIYAQWVEKSGDTSPIYTTVSMADGTYHIVMQDFVKADGTIAKFDADPNLPEGEKFRVWAETPAGLQLFYSWENGQMGPQSFAMDTSYNASNAIAVDQLNNFNFIYVPQTNESTMHNLADATPTQAVTGETGFINGTVFWNNNINVGSQTMGATATNSGGTTDTAATNVTVVGSYLSDYALQQIYSKAPAAIGTTNIRGTGWTDANEKALQDWIKQQIALEGTALWIGETVTTTTDANGKYTLQFNGTYGKEWNDRGYNGAILDSALNSNTRLPDALAISEGLPIGSTYADLFNHVASSPQIGTWYGDASAGVNAITIDAAPKHVNLDWTYVSLLNMDSYGLASPYYGNKFIFDTASTSWTNTLKVDAVADQYITGADFALFLDQMNFDVVNYNTNTTPATRGTTVTTNTVGLPSPALGNNLYQIVWYDKNGVEVAASPVQSPTTAGTIPSADFVVPMTALNGDVYTAKIYSIEPADGVTRSTFPLASDSFVVSVTDATVNEPNYIDTTLAAGTSTVIAAPLNSDGTAPPVGTKYAPAGTLPAWITVNIDGTISVNPDVTVPAGTTTVPVTVNYPDGTTDTIDVIITVTDKTAPVISPIADITVPAGTAMTPVTITVDDPTATTTVSGLPAGVTYAPETGVISGAPTTPGTYPVTVTSVDKDGNTSTKTFTYTVTDVKAPVISPIADVTTPEDVPMTPITVVVDDPTATTTVAGLPDGVTYNPATGVISGTPTTPGSYPITVTSVDAAGNSTTEKFNFIVTDKTAPDPTIINPVTSEDTVVTGVGAPGDTVTVTFPDGTTATAVVQPDGTWTAPIPPSVDLVGGEVLTATEADPAGNTSAAVNTTVKDVTPPPAPPIDPVTSNDTVVTGTGEPGDTITVKFPDGSTSTAVVQADGTWSAPLPAGVDLEGGELLTATAADPAGNVSQASSITVTDTTAPDPTIINPVTSEDTVVTGIGAPGNTVTVTFPDGTTATAVVQPDGTWTAQIPANVDLVGGEVLTAVEADPTGNTSAPVNTTVSDITPPPAPPVNPVTSEDPSITGTGEAGDTIIVTFPDGTTATTTVQPDGTWTLPLPAGKDLVGGEVLNVIEKDPAGNVSQATPVTVTDTTAPNLPTVNPVTSEDPAVTGVGTPGNTITVTFPNGTTGTAVVQPDGTWTVPVPAGVDLVGGEVLPVTSTDPAGNVSQPASVTVTDTTPPPAPPVNPVTSEDTVVTGTGVAGDTITVKFPDGSTGTAVVQPDGTWTVTIPAGIDLVGGEVLPVTEKDPAGNVSPASTVTVTDTTAPNLPTVNPVTSEDPAVTGVGTPGNTITVTFPNGTTGTAVVQPDGTWTVPLPAGVDLVGGEVLPVTSTDPAGNVSQPASVTVKDVTPPPAPPVNPVISEDTVVTGTGVAGDTITVKFPDGSTGTAVVQPDGTWAVTIPAGVDLVGGEVLPVIETDPAGNVSPASSVTVTDTTAPLAPPINTVSSTSTTVTGVGEPGNTVTVTFPDGSTSTAVVQPDGTWTAPIPAGVTLAGGEIITATQTDPAGNVSPASSTTVSDLTPPPAPVVNPVTSEDAVVTGTGTPGDTITVTFPNGATGTAVVQPDGTWSVTIPAGVDLVGGEVLPVTETDGAGNSGSTTVTVIVIDLTPPDAPTVNPVTSEDPAVTGIGTPGNTISVTFPDGTIGTAVVQPDGTWSVPVPAGVDLVGGEILPVTSTDPAGNVSQPTSVTVKDVTAPPAPPVNPVTSEDAVITGTGVAGDTITVKFPDGHTATTVVQPDGTWTLTIPAGVDLIGGELLTVTATDPAGNVSPSTAVTVTDTTAPNLPTVNPVTSEDPAVTGVGTPGNTITVTFPDGSTGTAVVQPDGTWSIPVPAGVDLVGGEVLPVTSTDPAGNESQPTSVTVKDVTAPPAPPINPVTSDDTVVTGTGIAGDTITVKFPNGSTATAVVQPDGTWSVTIPAGVDLVGGELLTATAADPAGNVSQASSITVTDTTAPDPTIINPVTSEDPTVTGIGAPGNTVTVTFPDGTTATAVVQLDGTWTAQIPANVDLVGGEVLTAVEADPTGNTSAPVNTTVKDITPPPAPPVNPVTSEDPSITGTGEAGDTIIVTFPDGTTATTTVQPDGTWTLPLPAGEDLLGGEVLTVVEKDPAGNVSQATSVTVTDTTAPNVPTVNPVTSEDPAVTGVGTPGNTITVTFPNGTTGTAVVQPDGTWTVPVPAGVDLVGGEVLPVTSTDPAGNVSQPASVTVKDVTPPPAPTVNPVTSEDTVVTGTGVAGDTITVTFPDGSTATTTVQPDGTWSVTIPAGVDLVGGEVLPVVETDPTGNVSPASTVTVTDMTAPAIAPIDDVTTPKDGPMTPITVVVNDPTATTTVTGLPDGVTYDPTTGVISGTPTQTGVYPVTVTSVDANGNTTTETFIITVNDVNAPVITPIADVTTPEDQPMTPIMVTVDDPTATTTVSGLPNGVTYDPATGVISGTPTDPGTYPVTVTSVDPDGNTSSTTFTITVTDATAPAITPIADVTTPEDQPMTPITVVVDDPTATTVVTGLPAGVTYDPTSGVISGTPTEPGTYPITVTSVDAAGNTSTETFVITVTDHTAPAITPIDDVTTPEDKVMFPIDVITDDKAAIIAVTGLPAGVTYDPALGAIVGTPVDQGVYPVTVTATDAAGNTSTETFVINVTDQTPPTIAPIADVETPEDVAITPITVVVNDPTATTTVTNLPPALTYDPATGVISGIPTLPGSYDVLVTSTDAAGNTSTEVFNITVTDVTSAHILPINDVVTPEDEPMTPITVVLDDPTASATVTGLPAGVTYDPISGVISGTPTEPGAYPVTVTSIDSSGNTETEIFTITVTDKVPPVITAIDDVTTPEDQPMTPIKVTVDDPTATTTVSALPAGVTYEPSTGVISGTPTEPGTYPITVTSVDTLGNTSTETFNIIVTDKTAPVIAPIADVTTPEDKPMTPITVTVDDKTATTTVDGLPVGVTYNPSTGQISGTPTEPGTYPVTVTSVDSVGNTTTETFNIIVTDVTAPVITPAIADVTTPEDKPMAPITVTVDDKSATVTVDGLPAGVTYDPAAGVISGTPTEPGTYPVTVTAVDGVGNSSTDTFIITVTDVTGPTITPIDDVTTPEDEPMAPITITVNDPTAPTTVTGLPAGVTFDPAAGVISGTPTEPGTYPVTVTSVDGAGNKTTETFNIIVTDITPVHITPIADMTTPEDEPMAPITVTVDDPTATTTVTGLPVGVTYNPATGIISGTPTEPGTYPVTVTSTDKAGNVSTETFIITVTDKTAPAIAPIADVTTPEDQAMAPITVTVNDPTATTTVTGLPAGVTYDPTTGVISGVPTTPGAYPVTVTSVDPSGNTMTETFNIIVTDVTSSVIAPIADVTTPEDKPMAPITVTVDDPTATTTVTGLPAGVTYDPTTGVISGTPTEPGTYPVTVTSVDPNGNTSTEVFTITVTDVTAPVIAPIADVTTPEDQAITPIAVTVDDKSATTTVTGLPVGVTYDPSTGFITGTPTEPGTYPVTVTSVDQYGNTTTVNFVITVTDVTAPIITPAVADVTTPEDKPMTPVTVTVNDPTAATTATGLPAGVTYDPATGIISGTPTEPGTYPVTITATDAAGNTSSDTFIITVTDVTAPIITPISDVTTPEDEPMAPITVTVNDSTATTTVTALPAGVTFDPATGVISGTPTEPGTYPVTVTSTDGAGNTTTETFNIIVTDVTPVHITPIDDVTTPEDQAITPITVTVDDNAATTTVTGLPAGVTYDPATGIISGTPTEPGTYPIVVVSKDVAGNTSSEPFVITVTDTTAPVITPIEDVTTPEDQAMTPITVVVNDTAVTTTVTGLPTGVTFDPSTGIISGTPTEPGVYPVTVTTKDAAGNTTTETFNITVTATPVTPDTTAPVIDVAPIKAGDTVVKGTSEPGSTVTVTLPDGTQVTTVTKDDGTWSVTVPAIKEGETVSAVSSDKAGNVSQPSTETAPVTPVTPDTTAPVIDVAPIKAGDTVVKGTSEPGSTVTVTLPDGTKVTTVTKDDGTWIVTVPAIKEGETVSAVSSDKAGNVSQPSTETAPVTPVTPDTTAPVVDVAPIKAGDTVVKGTSEPGSTVTVTLPDGTKVTTVTKDDGTWTVTVPAIKEGETVSAVSSDKAGNVSQPSTETAPVTPVIPVPPVTGLTIGDRVWNDANANGLQDVGEVGIEGATVALVKPNGTIITTLTDKDGHYAFTGLDAGTYTIYFNTPVSAISSPVNVDFNAHDAVDSDGSVITIQLTEDNMTIDSGFYYGNGGGTTTPGGTDNTGGGTQTPGGNDGGTVVVPPVTKGNLTIGDRVWNDANANGIQDVGEIGIEGATVALVKPDGTIITTLTDKDGHYAFTGLEAGTYTIYFNTPVNAISSPVNVDFNAHDAVDSDGSVITIQLTEDNMTIDSGFYYGNGGGTQTPGGTDNTGGGTTTPGGTDNTGGVTTTPGGTDNTGGGTQTPGGTDNTGGGTTTPGGTDNTGGGTTTPGGTDNTGGGTTTPGGTDNTGGSTNPGTTPVEDPTEGIAPTDEVEDVPTDGTSPTNETEDVPTEGTAPASEVGDNNSNTTGTKQVSLPDTGEKDNSGLAAGALLLGGLTLLVGRKRKQEDVQSEEE